MKTFIDDDYISVSKNDNILKLCFKQETKGLTDSSFKKEALKYIEIVQKENSRRIIVDMRKMGYQLSEEVIRWRNENIISVYNQVGVEKFAFISIKPTIDQDDPNNTFVTRTFILEEDAVRWLTKD